MILGLDLGSTSGWATWDGATVTSGTKDFPLLGAPALRYKAFRAWASEKTKGRVLVCYEATHHRNARTTQFLHALLANLMEACADAGAKTFPVHSLTLKKFVTGDGHAPKSMMCRMALAHGWLDGQRAEDRRLLSGLEDDEIAEMDSRERFEPINNQVDAISALYYGHRYGSKVLSFEHGIAMRARPLPGEVGHDAPPKVKPVKSDEERLFEKIAHEIDGSYGLAAIGEDE